MTNAVVQLDIKNLNKPLKPLTPRFAASYGVRLTNVPPDVSGVFLRLFTAGGGYFDAPGNVDDNGDVNVEIVGTCFPAVCRTYYEVHGTDGNGAATALGVGDMTVGPFSAGNTPQPQGSVISVATLPDATGALHQVVAVNLGTTEEPDWSWQVRTVDGTAAT